jgi:succinate dehydrogenase / fumarate reductase flavoprotein subunit
VPVEAGIHYFMGGIDVDKGHHTNIKGLYAAGECCSLYHGANRLGGNSLLGAIYGGITAANSLRSDWNNDFWSCESVDVSTEVSVPSPALIYKISDILYDAMGIVRNENDMNRALSQIEELIQENRGNEANSRRLNLAKMMLLSAIERKESRGAHYRSDYPNRDESFKRYIKCDCKGIINGVK